VKVHPARENPTYAGVVMFAPVVAVPPVGVVPVPPLRSYEYVFEFAYRIMTIPEPPAPPIPLVLAELILLAPPPPDPVLGVAANPSFTAGLV